MRQNLLADVFSIIKNMEGIGRPACQVPASNLAKDVLSILKERGYITGFVFVDDKKGGKFTVSLAGKINNCNVISPRFSVQKAAFIPWEKEFLPAAGTGLLFLTTSQGVLDHRTAQEKGLGGKLLGYVY